MSKTNQTTLESYDAHVEEYISGTPQDVSGSVKDWIDASLHKLPTSARVLELGSGFGRDAEYMEALGYRIERTDGSRGFVDWLNDHGSIAAILNIVTDDIAGQWDMVFADAVLLHLTREEMELATRKIFAALEPGGRFAFSLKLGEGEGWSDEKLGAPRYFCYWQADAVEELLRRTGFSAIEMSEDAGYSAKWVRVVAAK